jgi:hypothetical protein
MALAGRPLSLLRPLCRRRPMSCAHDHDDDAAQLGPDGKIIVPEHVAEAIAR